VREEENRTERRRELMSDDHMAADLRRFILTSIESVPHMEALLLFHRKPHAEWTAAETARELFISENQTAELLDKLTDAGFLAVKVVADKRVFRYEPVSSRHRELVDRLAKLYSKELIAVTNLIHSKARTKILGFADAFKIRKE